MLIFEPSLRAIIFAAECPYKKTLIAFESAERAQVYYHMERKGKLLL